MDRLTPYEQEEQMKQWRARISTIEYKAFQLCGHIVEDYEKRLESCENNLENLVIPLPEYPGDQARLREVIVTMQLLLGEMCLPKGCEYPRTLVASLKGAGMDDKYIDIEKRNCEAYLDKARNLQTRADEFTGHEMQVTYDVLRAKADKGGILTAEERKALDVASSFLYPYMS